MCNWEIWIGGNVIRSIFKGRIKHDRAIVKRGDDEQMISLGPILDNNLRKIDNARDACAIQSFLLGILDTGQKLHSS